MLDTLWGISKAVHSHFKFSPTSGKDSRIRDQQKAKLTKLLRTSVRRPPRRKPMTYRRQKTALVRQDKSTSSPSFLDTSSSKQPEISLPPKQPQVYSTVLTLLEQTPHHYLWNLPTATPQACLPSILWLTALLSTFIQYVWPRTLPSTYGSSTWKPTSSGLRRLIALHDKAITTAWDLVTQTHLSCRVS